MDLECGMIVILFVGLARQARLSETHFLKKQGGCLCKIRSVPCCSLIHAHTTIEEASKVETAGIVRRNRMAKGFAKVFELGTISYTESK
jgi:hypothetical protein